MVLYQSVGAVSVVSTLIGGGDTQSLTAIIRFVLYFLHLQAVGMVKYFPTTYSYLLALQQATR